MKNGAALKVLGEKVVKSKMAAKKLAAMMLMIMNAHSHYQNLLSLQLLLGRHL